MKLPAVLLPPLSVHTTHNTHTHTHTHTHTRETLNTTTYQGNTEERVVRAKR